MSDMPIDPEATDAEQPADRMTTRLPVASEIQFANVVKEYISQSGRTRALNGLNLNIPVGSFTALMGKSGCGKSTLLNLAGAMDFPTSGDVLLEGISTVGLDEEKLTQLRREKVGFVFQFFQLLPTLSIVENVELPLLLAGGVAVRKRALQQLETVGLGELAGRMPHQLSGGQMQRAAIARALVTGARIILADEPTGNLDTTTGNSVLALLQRICRERRTTVLMATHSSEAAAYADTIVRLRDGEIENVVQN